MTDSSKTFAGEVWNEIVTTINNPNFPSRRLGFFISASSHTIRTRSAQEGGDHSVQFLIHNSLAN